MHHRLLTFILGLWACCGMHDAGAASGFFSGHVWNDLNRNGIQDPGEPPMSDLTICVHGFPYHPDDHSLDLADFETDDDGYYSFHYSNNVPFVLLFGHGGQFGSPPFQVGNNRAIDNDLPVPWNIIEQHGTQATNIDVGLYFWNTAAALTIAADALPPGQTMLVTNGQHVTLTYRLANQGETHLSNLLMMDAFGAWGVGVTDCPDTLWPGDVRSFSTQIVVNASMTNHADAIAYPVDFLSCNEMAEYDPVITSAELALIVVTNDPMTFVDGDVFPAWWEIQYGLDPLNSNAPGQQSDADWMTDHEEWLADTDPTDADSVMPPAWASTVPEGDPVIGLASSSVDRLYRIWRLTNLLDSPQVWMPLTPETPGLGGPLSLPVSNAAPGHVYRFGVRAP